MRKEEGRRRSGERKKVASLNDLLLTRCARWTGGNRQVRPAERGVWRGGAEQKTGGGELKKITKKNK